MGLEKAIKVGAAVAGTALLVVGARRSGFGVFGGGSRRPTGESKSRRGGRSGGGGDEDDGDHGSATGLMVVAAMAGAALLALGAWIFTYSSGSRGPDDRRNKALEAARVDGDGGGDGDRILPNSYTIGNPNPNLVARRIKIMTYNIWSREDMEVNERMKAIGCLVEKHSPDVIFFQEITPFIYKIFQRFKWWELYEQSILPEKATKMHFCMLLSKLPVKISSCISFENSPVGRKLYSAFIEVGMEKKLVVATTHLKRPNPPMMHSTERMAQAEKALIFLDYFPNVVFGGDMNWDEDSDGALPLPDGWVDAWTHLRPGEDGWTFDTESNQMLRGRKLLQKRLDRFLCKLKDFKLIGLDIIGREVIPGILCSDNMRKTVPALPSDHYGLLLTVS